MKIGNNLILTVLSIILSATPLTVYSTPPRLAVIISVNGLQVGEIETYSKSLGSNGLARIITSGLYSPRSGCSYTVTDATTDYASIMTGSAPQYHGIISDHFFSLLDNDIVSCIDDARYGGINTSRNVSPRLLQATTFADQLKLTYPQSKVYSIASDAAPAIMLGGHLADAALWIDDSSGYTATSEYYESGLPFWAEKLNRDGFIENLCKTDWIAEKDIKRYNYLPTKTYLSGANATFVNFKPSDDTKTKTMKLKQSPKINEVINELAIKALRSEQMGTDNAPDLLCIEYNAQSPFDNTMPCAEKEDLMIKLDRSIRQLIDVIDIFIGIENCVIVLCAPNHNPMEKPVIENRKINSGVFNARRATALLNAYLMAIYGQGRWVTGYYNKNINLNKTLIEDNKIKHNEIADYAAQFMTEFSGVKSAMTTHQILMSSGSSYDMTSRIKNSYYKNRSGDIVFTLLPGWIETDEQENRIFMPTILKPQTPIAIWAEGILSPNQQPMMMEDICPTLCNIFNLPYPNGCCGDSKSK